MILLDTDHVSESRYATGGRAIRLQSRLNAVAGERVTISIVTVEEQLRGWMAAIARKRRVIDQLVAYNRLFETVAYFGRSNLVPFDLAPAQWFDALKVAKVRIGTMDLKIAATALAHDALLLSANLRDFRQVPGLRVENWLD